MLTNSVDEAKRMGLCPANVDTSIININVALRDNRVYDHLRLVKRKVEQVDILEAELKADAADGYSVINKETKINRLAQNL